MSELAVLVLASKVELAHCVIGAERLASRLGHLDVLALCGRVDRAILRLLLLVLLLVWWLLLLMLVVSVVLMVTAAPTEVIWPAGPLKERASLSIPMSILVAHAVLLHHKLLLH